MANLHERLEVVADLLDVDVVLGINERLHSADLNKHTR